MGRANDECVIYWSSRDSCWIAHSLRMDQIGTGECVLAALEDLLRAVRQFQELARSDRLIALLREAPPQIQKMAQTAQPLPREMYEVAYRRVHGDWPQDLPVRIEPTHRKRFKTDIHELVG